MTNNQQVLLEAQEKRDDALARYFAACELSAAGLLSNGLLAELEAEVKACQDAVDNALEVPAIFRREITFNLSARGANHVEPTL
jgi:hypothetical protein